MHYSYGYNFGSLVKVGVSLEDLPDWATHWLTGGSHQTDYGFSDGIGKLAPIFVSEDNEIVEVTVARVGTTDRTKVTISIAGGIKVNTTNKYIYIAFGPDYAIRMEWDSDLNVYTTIVDQTDLLDVFIGNPLATEPLYIDNQEGDMEVVRSFLTEEETLDLLYLRDDEDNAISLVSSYCTTMYSTNMTISDDQTMTVDGFQSDGPNSYIAVGVLLDNRSHAYSIWFNAVPENTPLDRSYLLALNGSGVRSMLSITDYNTIIATIGSDASPSALTNDTVITDGNWHNAIVSVDGDTSKFYLDGELVGTGSEGNSAGSSTYSICHREGSDNYNFLGKVLNISFYDRPITSDLEALRLYRSSKKLL